MKKLPYLFGILMMLSLTSCELAGDIFEAGIWTGVLAVGAVIALVIWLISRSRK